jgi:hypothetical protein
MTESLPVLLHAAARGARLEIWSDLASKWVENEGMRPFKDEKWHIHPKDYHLRYGPISSVLYEAAKKPKSYIWFGTEIEEYCAQHYVQQAFFSNDVFDYSTRTELARSLFLLFVAESLIEDGL